MSLLKDLRDGIAELIELRNLIDVETDDEVRADLKYLRDLKQGEVDAIEDKITGTKRHR